MNKSRRGSLRAAVLRGAVQDHNRTSSYKHLRIPRGVNMFKEEPGSTVRLDILSYFVTDSRHPDRDDEFEKAIVGALWYRRPYRRHNIGSGDAAVVAVCPGKKCPICEYRQQLVDGGAKWDSREVQALRGSQRNLYYVVPIGHRKYEEVPHLWDIAGWNFQDQLVNELLENEELADFPSLFEEGLTLKIRFSAEKTPDGRNEFAKTSRIDFESRNYTYGEDYVRDLVSLDEIIDLRTYAEVERMFYDAEDSDAEDSDDDKDNASNRRPASRVEGASVREPATRSESSPRREVAPRHEPEAERGSAPLRGVASKLAARRESSRRDEDDPELTRAHPELTRAQRRPPANVPSRQTPARPRTSQKEEKSGPPSRQAANGGESPDDNRCPSGYRFGVDTDQQKECEECVVWHDCQDEREMLAR